jgi:hypothetical protein
MYRQQDFSHLNEKQKLNLLTQLVKMARADKVFKFIEFKYLTEIAELLHIPVNQLDEILEKEIEAPIPEKMIDRTRQIYRLTIMMMIDHIITKEEKLLLKNYAVQLGLIPDRIEVMIDRMQQNKGGMLLDKDLCEIFSITLN